MDVVTYMANEAMAVKDMSIPPDTITIKAPMEKRAGITMDRVKSTRLLLVKNWPLRTWIKILSNTIAPKIYNSVR
jgi:hypothetical protein